MADTKLQRKISERYNAAVTKTTVVPVAPLVERMGLKRVNADGAILKALPGDFTLITITGKFIDLAGNPVQGTVTFTPSYTKVLDDTANTVSIVPITLTATLDVTGAISINIPATDDPDVIPVGWSYLVSYNFTDGFKQSYSIVVPFDGGSFDLSDVNPVDPVVGLDAFVTFGELQVSVEAGIDAVIVISDTAPADTTVIWIDITT